MTLGLLLGEFGIKNIICRPRPFVTYDFTVNGHIPSGYSFPSGHTTSSFAAATVIIIRKEKFAVFTAVLAFLIAFSRLYNCVHYPTDVICGAVLGIALAIITCLVQRKSGYIGNLPCLCSFQSSDLCFYVSNLLAPLGRKYARPLGKAYA